MTKDTEQVQEYINNEGQFCPFCEEGDIEAISPMMIMWEDREASQLVKCPTCGKIWRDEYRLQLYDFEEIDPDPMTPCKSSLGVPTLL